MNQEYHQIPLDPGSIEKTAFSLPEDHLEVPFFIFWPIYSAFGFPKGSKLSLGWTYRDYHPGLPR